MYALKTVIVILIVNHLFVASLKINVVHNNDMISTYDEMGPGNKVCRSGSKKPCYGGYARLATVLKKERRRGNTLFLNAGNTFTGSIYFAKFKSKVVVDLWNHLKPDATAVGYKELGSGMEHTKYLLDNAKFPVLSANMNISSEPGLADCTLHKSTILTVGGRKVGIVGYTAANTPTRYLKNNITFNTELEALRAECIVLRRQGVHIIIALGCAGFKINRELAEKAPLVDLVVGGGNMKEKNFFFDGNAPHEEVPTHKYPFQINKEGRKIPILQLYGTSKYVGVAQVEFDSAGGLLTCHGKVLFLDKKVKMDPDALQALKPFQDTIREMQNKMVGRTYVTLGNEDDLCLEAECNLANLVTDLKVNHIANNYKGIFTDTPIALTNAGIYGASIEHYGVSRSKHDIISEADMYASIRYPSPMVCVTLPGTYLYDVLEKSVKEANKRNNLLHFSGLKITYDYKHRPMGRITKAFALCNNCSVPIYLPLQSKNSYRMVINEFLAEGGDGYTEFKEHGENFVTVDVTEEQLLATYFKDTYFVVMPEHDNRMIMISSCYPVIVNHFLLSACLIYVIL